MGTHFGRGRHIMLTHGVAQNGGVMLTCCHSDTKPNVLVYFTGPTKRSNRWLKWCGGAA